MKPYEPSAIERILFRQPDGTTADLLAHIAVTLIVLAPLIGFAWSASSWLDELRGGGK